MPIKSLLLWAKDQLKMSSTSPLLDAEILLSYCLKKKPSFLLAHSNEIVGLFCQLRFRRLIQRRKQGIPIAYLTQIKEFYGRDFFINDSVLVPRPDTEILVSEAVELINKNDDLIEVGVGSGCISISLLKEIPHLKVLAVDVSKKALKVAKKNSTRHKVQNRLKLVHSDLLENIPPESMVSKSLVVVANLPYLPKDYSQKNPYLIHEPSLALYAEKNGLDIYFRLINQLQHFKPRLILLECFDFQVDEIRKKLPSYITQTKKMTGRAVLLTAERKEIG